MKFEAHNGKVFKLRRADVPSAIVTHLRLQPKDSGWDMDRDWIYLHHSQCLGMARRAALAGLDVDYSALPPYLVARIRPLIQEWESFARERLTEVDREGAKGHYGSLLLLSTAPPELVKAAYRCLSKLYHPDLGGSDDQMAEISKAYKAIKDTW